MSASTTLTPRWPYALPSAHEALAERLALAATRRAEREANAAAIRAAGYGAGALAAEREAGLALSDWLSDLCLDVAVATFA